jgi:hypothetical protein
VQHREEGPRKGPVPLPDEPDRGTGTSVAERQAAFLYVPVDQRAPPAFA